jgi:hypothetical protein
MKAFGLVLVAVALTASAAEAQQQMGTNSGAAARLYCRGGACVVMVESPYATEQRPTTIRCTADGMVAVDETVVSAEMRAFPTIRSNRMACTLTFDVTAGVQ